MAMYLLDAQIKCLSQIFGFDVEQRGLPPVTYQNLAIFFEQLSCELPQGFLLTGVGCEGYFEWQGRYETALVEAGNYDRMKLRKGAYSDAFTFVRCERINQRNGVIAKVCRITDSKIFKIPLVDLEAYDSHTHAALLIESYARWYRSQASVTNDEICLDRFEPMAEALA